MASHFASRSTASAFGLELLLIIPRRICRMPPRRMIHSLISFNKVQAGSGRFRPDAYHMVNVPPVHLHIVKQRKLVMDRNCDGPHHNGRDEKSKRSQERPQ